MQLLGKQVLVLGLGESGVAMTQWCLRCGARVRVLDSRSSPPGAAAVAAEVRCADLNAGEVGQHLQAVDLVAISPGLSLSLKIVRLALQEGIPVVGEIEMFAWALADRQLLPDAPQVVALTGTNGKTTVTSMLGHLCRAAGVASAVAGNISPAALSALLRCLEEQTLPRIWVLELSSFQLETTCSLNLTAAAVLNVAADHLDRHATLANYAAAKQRIFRQCAIQVLNRQDEWVMRMAQAEKPQISFGLDAPPATSDWGLLQHKGVSWLAQGEQRILPLAELSVAGRHNAANALAALALYAACDLPLTLAARSLPSFCGLPHRVELVAQHLGVSWYDDSKGTNVGATVAALGGLGEGMALNKGGEPGKIVLLAGGDGKGQDFAALRAPVVQYARAVVLFGRDAPLLQQALAGCGIPLLHAADMRVAVRLGAQQAAPGDAVLLSPACASFDMFRDYQQRAAVFCQELYELLEETAQ